MVSKTNSVLNTIRHAKVFQLVKQEIMHFHLHLNRNKSEHLSHRVVLNQIFICYVYGVIYNKYINSVVAVVTGRLKFREHKLTVDIYD